MLLAKNDKRFYILELINDIDKNGYVELGKLEGLSENLSPYFSRKIDDKNRLV
ncbi:MAG: type II toxin-antitoxin system YoeB family toxin [Campylobacter sp.]|nr:type II toxin-antitoxin system YoeB family toxin [Campylobacter sp.]